MLCSENFIAFFQELKKIIKIIKARITELITEMNEVVQLTFYNVVSNPSLVYARPLEPETNGVCKQSK
jgi:hypothetical protein